MPPKTILVADHDAPFVERFTLHLKKAGYSVITAYDQNEAQHLIEENRFALIISGIDFRTLSPPHREDYQVPHIVMTKTVPDTTSIKALQNGTNDFICSSCSEAALLYRVKNVLDHHATIQQYKHLQQQLEEQREKVQEAHHKLEQEGFRRQKSEEKLGWVMEQLESLVSTLKGRSQAEQSTAGISPTEAETGQQTSHLNKSIIANVRTQIFPFIQKLEATFPSTEQQQYIEAIKFYLDDIMDSFTSTLSTRFTYLTPTELRIAQQIREGFTSKDIARLHHLSVRTVEVHRENIRSKLGLKHKKANLRSYLLSIE
jgi:DNA-binding NarL/FixJ family response regulator